MDSTPKKIGLACAGGGIEGCIYEIGALCALDEVIEGAEAHRLDIYVGVSAGASTPEVLVQRVVTRLRDWGAEIIEERPGKEENVTFKIPRALKRATG